MTNKEKYKQAFSVLQTSENYSLEVEKMAMLNKKRTVKAVAVAVAVCLILIGGSGIVYAANLGGIQRTIQLWIHGDQTDAAITFNSDGSYNMSYQDENGELIEADGGGVSIDDDGNEQALTDEELMDHLNDPEVEYEDDSTVWVYYYDQKIDITDKFKDNVCYVKVSNGDETLYMTIKYHGGWCTSPNKYLSPSNSN
ncbi:hypothetical protein [Anaerocolumna sp. MB42-C2]|uniref:hypothetical protein n=1 Tax=Anaerocolumna sp. MB42-C2 TaxID=3070997 RepID=UPI0027E14041|nr:hypothetical protein [Anaerocolumna sp. MB42-C2]WMJ89354.1 hypothetical protein RBU59_07470 [Anaerocolumna sp. MB42-C2]